MKNKSSLKEKTVIYQAKNGAISLKTDSKNKTLLASLNQIADLFGVQKSAISKHLKNIFDSGELSSKSTVSKMETVQKEGERNITRQIEVYNLDAIIAVGYRVNSKSATEFRIWATKIINEHLTRGYTINRRQIANNYELFIKSVKDLQALLPKDTVFDSGSILELIREFASTWVSLDAYDRESVASTGLTKKQASLTGDELLDAISQLRTELIKKGEASTIFAQERNSGSINGIVGNVMQSLGGKSVYPTIEEKAANLLYFIIKNHPFVDGNKRSGAFAFIWFLKKFGAKNAKSINPNALTAIALLVAESKPDKRDQMLALVTRFLN